MIKTSVTRTLLASILFFTVGALHAASPSELLPDNAITAQSVEKIFDSAFLKAEVDEDGDVLIRDDGLITVINVDGGDHALRFYSIWRLKDTVSELNKLRFTNSLNDDLRMVKFSLADGSRLLCEYDLLYERGVTPYAIVNSYRKFSTICRGAVTMHDVDNIVD